MSLPNFQLKPFHVSIILRFTFRLFIFWAVTKSMWLCSKLCLELLNSIFSCHWKLLIFDDVCYPFVYVSVCSYHLLLSILSLFFFHWKCPWPWNQKHLLLFLYHVLQPKNKITDSCIYFYTFFHIFRTLCTIHVSLRKQHFSRRVTW